MTRSCEDGNEIPGSTKGGKFLYWITVDSSRRTLLYGVSYEGSELTFILEPLCKIEM